MEREEMEKLNNEELNKIIILAQEIIGSRNGKKLEVHLHSNKYKGSGKCWVAKVDEFKKIVGFVDPHTTIPNGYQKEKIYFLSDGKYLLCQTGSKSHDERRYITVQNGEEIKDE